MLSKAAWREDWEDWAVAREVRRAASSVSFGESRVWRLFSRWAMAVSRAVRSSALTFTDYADPGAHSYGAAVRDGGFTRERIGRDFGGLEHLNYVSSPPVSADRRSLTAGAYHGSGFPSFVAPRLFTPSQGLRAAGPATLRTQGECVPP